MAAVRGFPQRVIELVDERRQGRCEMCLLQFPEVVYHHRRPKGLGGSNYALIDSAVNCFGVCAPCHRFIHDHPRVAYEHGWLLFKNQNPVDVVPRKLSGQELFELRKKVPSNGLV